MPYALTNARVFTGETWLADTAVLVEADSIFAVTNHFAEETERVDLGNLMLAPAFIDLQIYGAGGAMFNAQPNPAAIRRCYDEIRRSGTLHFQITLSSMPMETVWDAIEATKTYLAEHQPGLIGLHLEGPYFNPEKRGAHLLANLRQPQTAELREILERGAGAVTYLTAAPELFSDDDLDLVLTSGIHFSAGHSNATYAQARRGFERGIGRVTHLFNAMSAFGHREPGLAGATLDSATFENHPYASIIPDGIHLSWAALRIAKAALGERLFFITDAVTEDPTGAYHFRLAGDHFVDENGLLSGSALTMMQAVKNGVEHGGFSLGESLRMASTYPAQAAGLGERLGRIEAGFAANLVIFDDAYRVRGVVERGRVGWF